VKVAVFGLGYVGCVSLGCIAKNGDKVIGVDVNPAKVELINKGKPTIIEKDIDKIISEGWKLKKIEATADYIKAVIKTDISIICVGTPSGDGEQLDLGSIYRVAEQIGEGLGKKEKFHTVVIRSTVLPGTSKKVSDIIEKRSRKKKEVDFDVVANPEFLREGSSVEDYYNPPMIVLGGGKREALNMLEELYKNINAPIYKVDYKVAEMIKLISNSFHALKVTFANEVGNICKKLGIDSHQLMELFCKDSILNISPYYLKPGFAYGGSCLPKDLRALRAIAKGNDIKTNVLDSISKSNEYHKKVVLNLITRTKKNNIGIFGLGFKEGTDDLRDSPIIDIIKHLSEDNCNIFIYDKYVNFSNILGLNKKYIEDNIPNLSKMLSNNIEYVVKNSEVLVIVNKEKEYKNILEEYPNKIIIDLVRIKKDIKYNGKYQGIGW
jgi:GDP-mannose 6-dehydrogenase